MSQQPDESGKKEVVVKSRDESGEQPNPLLQPRCNASVRYNFALNTPRCYSNINQVPFFRPNILVPRFIAPNILRGASGGLGFQLTPAFSFQRAPTAHLQFIRSPVAKPPPITRVKDFELGFQAQNEDEDDDDVPTWTPPPPPPPTAPLQGTVYNMIRVPIQPPNPIFMNLPPSMEIIGHFDSGYQVPFPSPPNDGPRVRRLYPPQ